MRSIPAAFTPAAYRTAIIYPRRTRRHGFLRGFFFRISPPTAAIKSPIIANYNETNYPLQLAVRMDEIRLGLYRETASVLKFNISQ